MATRHRTVFLIPGYDPRGPGAYHRLIRRELERFARVRGVAARISPMTDGQGRSGADALWEMAAEWPEVTVATRFRLLGWHDLTARETGSSPPVRLLAAARTFLWMIASGLYFDLARRHWPTALVALYPAVWILLVLAAMAALPVAVPRLLGPLGVAEPLGIALGLAGALAVWQVSERLDRRTFAWHLANLARAAHRLASGHDDAMEARLDAFAAEVIAFHDAAPPDEELILSGHSCGSSLAIHVMGRVLSVRPDFGARFERAPILVTMGSVHAFANNLGPSAGFHHGLRRLGPARHVDWIEVFAPEDAIGSGRCDAVSELVPDLPLMEKRNPRLLSARLDESLEPARLAALRRRLFGLHFQFLAATDRPGSFDFHEVLLGPAPRVPLGLERPAR